MKFTSCVKCKQNKARIYKKKKTILYILLIVGSHSKPKLLIMRELLLSSYHQSKF